jgi:hypothetical protein
MAVTPPFKDDPQPAVEELAFAEAATGYAFLHQRLQGIVGRYGP